MLDNAVSRFCHALPLPCIMRKNSVNYWLVVCVHGGRIEVPNLPQLAQMGTFCIA